VEPGEHSRQRGDFILANDEYHIDLEQEDK
jgi:hypothetical protein